MIITLKYKIHEKAGLSGAVAGKLDQGKNADIIALMDNYNVITANSNEETK